MKHNNWLFGKDGAFFRAAVIGNMELAAQLAADGANIGVVSIKGFTPLHRAAQNGHEPVVEFLLRNGANPTAMAHDGSTPRSLAEKNGHRTIVKLLKQHP